MQMIFDDDTVQRLDQMLDMTSRNAKGEYVHIAADGSEWYIREKLSAWTASQWLFDDDECTQGGIGDGLLDCIVQIHERIAKRKAAA